MTQASKIRAAILDFYAACMMGTKRDFTANDLRMIVNSAMDGKVAPGSSDRILRMLRQGGMLNYIVLNRAQSLYRFIAVSTASVPDATGDSNA